MPSWKKKISFGLGALLLAGSMSAHAELGVSKTRAPGFSGQTPYVGDVDGFLIEVRNSFASGEITSVSFTDYLPDGFKVAGAGLKSVDCYNGANTRDDAASTAFGNKVSADLGSTTISVSGATIPAKGTSGAAAKCLIEVEVTSTKGSGTNTIGIGAVTGKHGSADVSNAAVATQALNFQTLAVPTLGKSFSPSTIVKKDEPTTLTLTIQNNSGQPLPLNDTGDTPAFAIRDRLGDYGLKVASAPAASASNCGAISFEPNAGDTAITAVGGVVPANATCTLKVDVVADGSDTNYEGTHTNTIDRNNDFGNKRGLVPAQNATATLKATSPLKVEKAFTPATVAAGQEAILTITVKNESPVTNMTLNDFADPIAGGASNLVITGDPTASCTGGSSLGSLSGKDTSTLSVAYGSSLNADSQCVITVPYKATLTSAGTPETFINTIAEGAITSSNVTGVKNNGVAVSVNVVDQFLVEKSSSPAQVVPGSPVRFRVTAHNYSIKPQPNTELTDNLPAGMTLLNAPAAKLSSGSCSNFEIKGTATVPVFKFDMLAGTSGNPASCQVEFWAMLPEGAAAGPVVNQIPAGGLCAGTGSDRVCNHTSSSADFTVRNSTLVVEKKFDGQASVAGVAEGTAVTMTIDLVNWSAQELSSARLLDELPLATNSTQMRIATPSNASTTCGGTLTATAGGDKVELTGATVPARANNGTGAAGRCQVRVNVTGAAGTYVNTLPEGAASAVMKNADGTVPAHPEVTSPGPVSATVEYESALSGTKSFAPNQIQPGGRSTVTLTMTNGKDVVLNNVSITDTLPAGMVVANPANAYSTCDGSPLIEAAAGAVEVKMSGARLPRGSCALLFDVTATGSGDWKNEIPAGGLTADGGVQNEGSFDATLSNKSGGGVMAQIEHGTPSVAAPGATTRLTITLTNSGAIDLSGLNLDTFFTDNGLAGGALTGERIAGTPNATTNCPGGVVTAAANGTGLSLAGATLEHGQSCTIEVDVTMLNTGNVTAVIPESAITTDQGVSNVAPSSSTLTTSSGLGVDKTFTPKVVEKNKPSRLRITLYNPTSQPIKELAFTDTYPTGLQTASPSNIDNQCGGVVTSAPGAGQVILADGSLKAGDAGAPASCYIELDVVAGAEGEYPNTIVKGGVTGESGGSPITNDEPTTDTLRVKAPIIVNKAIADFTLDAGNPASFTTGQAGGQAGTPLVLSIRLENPNADMGLTGVRFLDELPKGLTVAPTPGVANDCGGVVTATPSGTSVRLAGGALAASSSCVIKVNVLSNSAGTYTNTIPSGGVETNEGVKNGEQTRAQVVISTPPSVTKEFEPKVIPQNGTSRLTIYVNNPNQAVMKLTANMVDNLPDSPGQMRVAADPNVGGSCGVANVEASANGTTVTLKTGTEVQPGGCTIEVDVTASVSGDYTNTIPAGGLKTDLGNNPEPATAPLSVSTLGFISGKVYLDNDLNSSFGSGDSPLSGVRIELRQGSSCQGALVTGVNNLVNPQTTDAAGNYLFSGLPAGTYSVCQGSQPVDTLNGMPVAGDIVENNGSGGSQGAASNPSDTSSQIANIILGSNASGEVSGSSGNDFPEVRPASLSGSIYVDTNNDGTRDPGEPGLPGEKVILKGKDWLGRDVEITTTTDANGNYRFDDVPPGNYKVTQPKQPENTSNGKTTAGNSSGTVPTTTTPEQPVSEIGNITLTPGYASEGNNFGELTNGRTLSGKVFMDPNDNGIPETGENGIRNVRIELTGTDVNGKTVTRETWTNEYGDYSFTDLPPGVYTVTQADGQPAGTLPGKTVPEGGVTRPGVTATGTETAKSAISGIDLTENKFSVDNWFAEVGIPGLSGTVWIDTNHDRVLDGGETVLEGWTVELLKDGAVIQQTVTDSNGKYNFSDLTPGDGYDVQFRHPETGTLFGRPVPNEQGKKYTPGAESVGNPGGADNRNGTLSGISIKPGLNIVEQSLPLDPSGVVYDAISRQPVAGAKVTIQGPPGFNAATHVLGGSASQVTGSDGMYKFLLLNGAPVGTYTLLVESAPGYAPGVSQQILACEAQLTVGKVPDPALVQASDQPPAESAAMHDPEACANNSSGLASGAGSTQYYLSFYFDGESADLVNNHIPLDPVLSGAIIMTKTTPKVNVVRGEMVPYVLTARNTLGVDVQDVAIEDQIPAGFKYVKGSSQVGGIPQEPKVNGRRLVWPGQTVKATEPLVIKMLLVVGTGVGYNEYINQTWAMNEVANSRISNLATATVRVVADPTFECSDLIGTVYDDKNRNGYQDKGEPGLPGVRVATPKGWLVTTDNHGRYHIACADVPNEMRGSNFIVKVDERTLPSGYRVVTENPRVVRLSQGRLVKANFGASIHRVVRLDLTPDAFDGKKLKPGYQEQMGNVMQALHAEPSILRIAYRLPVGEKPKEARQRIKSVTKWVKKNWEPQECCYDLQLEEEIVPAIDSVEVVR